MHEDIQICGRLEEDVDSLPMEMYLLMELLMELDGNHSAILYLHRGGRGRVEKEMVNVENEYIRYHLAGGMQDWQYRFTNSLEITIEMGCFKFPTNAMLPK